MCDGNILYIYKWKGEKNPEMYWAEYQHQNHYKKYRWISMILLIY